MNTDREKHSPEQPLEDVWPGAVAAWILGEQPEVAGDRATASTGNDKWMNLIVLRVEIMN